MAVVNTRRPVLKTESRTIKKLLFNLTGQVSLKGNKLFASRYFGALEDPTLKSPGFPMQSNIGNATQTALPICLNI